MGSLEYSASGVPRFIELNDSKPSCLVLCPYTMTEMAMIAKKNNKGLCIGPFLLRSVHKLRTLKDS